MVQLIAEGHTNKSVGAVLNLSVKTVETHRASAMRKLNVSSTDRLLSIESSAAPLHGADAISIITAMQFISKH
jgi:DNA-binding CsgD family transcriptional regulator